MANKAKLGTRSESDGISLPPPPSRQGCSCWTQLMYAFLILFCLGVMTFLLWTSLIEKQAYSKLIPLEVTQFQDWLHKPIKLTPPQRERVAPLPENLALQRAALVREGLLQYAAIEPLLMTHNAVFVRLFNGVSVTPQELDDATSAAENIKHLTARAKAMLDHPDYRHAPEYESLGQSSPWGFRGHSLDNLTLSILSQAVLEAKTGKNLQALETADTATRLAYHHPLAYDYLFDAATSTLATFRPLVLLVASQTSDTTALRTAFNLVSRHRELAQQLVDVATIPGEGVAMELQMVEDGYISPRVMTPASVELDVIKQLDYYNWLLITLPSDSPRRAPVEKLGYDLQNIINGTGGPLWQQRLLQILQVGPGKLILRKVSRSFSLHELTARWKKQASRASDAKAGLARHDLLMYAIANRLAKLSDIQRSDILPYVAADPFSSGPLQFDSITNRFYSVGPDGKDGSSDDIHEPEFGAGDQGK